MMSHRQGCTLSYAQHRVHWYYFLFIAPAVTALPSSSEARSMLENSGFFRSEFELGVSSDS
jgi:hypothetical protein